MMRTSLLATVALLTLPASAVAADVDVGVGAALAMDLPDRASGEYTSFGPGPALFVPVRIGLASHARLRTTLRADLGIGTDRVTWAAEVDGRDVRLGSDEHWSMFAASGLTLGPEIVLPVQGAVRPYLGAEAGGAWVGNYHSFGGATAQLVDPDQNDIDNPNNVDPFTSQLAFLTDAHGGVQVGEEGVSFWAELGYSMAFVGASPLKKSPEGLDARREAYGWNPIRLGAGVSFRL